MGSMARWHERSGPVNQVLLDALAQRGQQGEGSGRAVFTLTGGSGMRLQSSRDRMNLPRSVADDETGCA